MHQDRLESTGLFLLPQPNFETISCRIQIVSPCAQGTDWSAPDYITNLLTLVTDIPSRSSLHASSNDDLFQPRTEQRTDDRALHSLSPHLVHEIAYRHNWNSCGRRQQRWGAIWSLFIFARHGDYVMHLQADCRRCTTNSAVTITVTRLQKCYLMTHLLIASCPRQYADVT